MSSVTFLLHLTKLICYLEGLLVPCYHEPQLNLAFMGRHIVVLLSFSLAKTLLTYVFKLLNPLNNIDTNACADDN